MTATDRILKTADVMAILRCSNDRVYQLCRLSRDPLPSFRLAGGHHQFRESAVWAWIARQERRTGTADPPTSHVREPGQRPRRGKHKGTGLEARA